MLANGPIRVMFELMYEPFDAGGTKVTEIRRITLDAGHHLNRFEIVSDGARRRNAALAAGIRKNPGSLRADDPRRRRPAHLGADQAGGPPRVCRHRARQLADTREADGNYLAIAAPQPGPRVYYAGSAWDRGGDIKSM